MAFSQYTEQSNLRFDTKAKERELSCHAWHRGRTNYLADINPVNLNNSDWVTRWFKPEINLSGNDINFLFDVIEKATNLQYLTIDSMGLKSLEDLDKASGLFFLHANSNNFDTFPIEFYQSGFGT